MKKEKNKNQKIPVKIKLLYPAALKMGNLYFF